MKRILVWLALCLLLLPNAVLAATADNLIQNGDFEQITDSGDPSFWMRDMWLTTAGVSRLSLSDERFGGAHSVEVRSDKPNDARFVQRVAVEPNTCYLLSCRVRAEGIPEDEAGASIAVKDTFVSSEYVYDTRGQWTEVTLYGITGDDQRELTVMARLGDYGSMNTGAAWFDDFQMRRVENAVLDESVASFATLSPDDGDEDATSFQDRLGGLFSGFEQVALILVMGAAVAALWALLMFLVGRGRIDLNRAEGGSARTLGWMLGIALVIRLILSFTVRGYSVDINCFEAWSQRLAGGGLASFYEKGYFCDYPPGYLYVLYALGGLRSLLGVAYDTGLDWLIIKLPPMLLDITAAMLVFAFARKHVGKTWALLLAGFYAFNPAAILNSAAWGQIDAALAILLLLSIHLAMEDRWLPSLCAFGVAILIKPQALMFAPLGLLAVVMEIARAERPMKLLKKMLLAALAAIALMLLLSVPFIRSLDPKLLAEAPNIPGFLKPVWYLFSLYGNTLSSYPHITINACNLYTLLDMNWVNLAEVPVASICAWGMMGLSYLFAGCLYVKSNDKRKLPLLAALLLTLVFTFGAKMHERYLFPALVLLLVAYIEDMDIRVLIAFLALTFTQFVNAALVLRSEHLQAAEQIINAGVSLVNILSSGLMCWTCWDLCVRKHSVGITRVYQHQDTKIAAEREARLNQFAESIFKPRDYRLNLRLRDWALIIALTGLYALLAFSNLGATQAPETSWTSSAEGEQITIDLGETRDFHMAYYGGICDTNFKVQISDDGEAWSKEYDADYHQGLVFRWNWYEPQVEDEDSEHGYSPLVPGYPPKHPLITARYVRLTMVSGGLILYELAFVDADGEPIPITAMHVSGGRPEVKSEAANLFDEQHTVPAYPSYLNGTYFDEIYHARTAYENLNGMHTYEWTHPPLGKLLIAVGIKLFGMNPFGWRFMGTLFGVLMVPLMYLLAKQLLRRTSISFIAAFLMAVDCMHFTQTRIATIDSFVVFFIMLMYLFMFRYCMMSFFHAKLWRTLIPLALCGITMGLAAATKWIGLYAAVGLAVLLFYTLGVRYREYRYVKKHMDEIDAGRRRTALRITKQFGRNAGITLAWCVVFFIAVPLLIYYFSYYWQMTPDNAFNVRSVWNLQQSMMRYHSGLRGDPHLFRSPWYQWPFVAWPMWYYTGNEFMQEGWVSSISCMGNPVVFWGGLAAMLFVLGRMFTNSRSDKRYVFIAVGFLSQYLPWVLVPRSTFIYHYFASVPFIILATALLMDWVRKKSVFAFKLTAAIYCACALLMFAFFYPVISGTPMPLWYAKNLRWFNWINY